MSIPIVIGVTGHRDIRREDEKRLKEEVRKVLLDFTCKYPSTKIIMLNSIAAGADSLCAEIALELGISLVCPLPMEISDYEKDFHEEERDRFYDLIGRAEEVFVVPAVETQEPGRDFCYRQAGIYVAEHSHVLLALWDGNEGSPGGCGTAEAVGFALNKDFKKEPELESTCEGAVAWIVTPRIKNSEQGQNLSAEPFSYHLLENMAGSLQEQCRNTESFNRDARDLQETGTNRLLTGKEIDKCGQGLEQVYARADLLSLKFQTKYLSALAALSGFCVLLVLTFLLYDEVAWIWALPVYGVVLVLYYIIYKWIQKGSFHEKYLSYRQLSETMRVQFYLHAVGIDVNVTKYFTWTQKQDAAWIRNAVDTLLSGNDLQSASAVSPDCLKREWIEGQLDYHTRAQKRNESKLKKGNVISGCVLAATLVLYVIVLIMELGMKESLESLFLGVSLDIWLKIIWGCFSAVTLFVSGYYGRLSFERKIYDHERMRLLFEAARKAYEKDPSKYGRIFTELAKEEIIENGNWVSYCRENRPVFTL